MKLTLTQAELFEAIESYWNSKFRTQCHVTGISTIHRISQGPDEYEIQIEPLEEIEYPQMKYP